MGRGDPNYGYDKWQFIGDKKKKTIKKPQKSNKIQGLNV